MQFSQRQMLTLNHHGSSPLPESVRRPVGLMRLGRRQLSVKVLIAGLIIGFSVEASAASKLLGGDVWARNYSSHPTVTKVRQAGYMTAVTRALTLSNGLPLDRALAVVSAMSNSKARKFKVAQGIARALRARHSIGPSGAMLGKAIPATKLSAREALLLGWARAREARGNRTKMAVRSPSISGAGPLQLLAQAAAAAPQEQAPQLALALAQASVAPTRGKRACAAYGAVQKAARDGRKATVLLSIAEGATASAAKLGTRCSKKARKAFKTPIQLAPPPAEVRKVISRPGRPTRPGRPSSVGREGQGIAFSVLAPIFKGYLNVPLVAQLARRVRLDAVMLWQLLKTDPTGDVTLAALNASVLMRRLAPDDTFEVALEAVLRVRGQLGASKAQVAAIKVSQLSGPQAMTLAYARALQGRGRGKPELPGDPAILRASPRQLFAHARQRVPANAALGPILFLSHKVDLQRAASPCAAQKRAEATGFVLQKSTLPSASKAALIAAMTAVRSQCRTGAASR